MRNKVEKWLAEHSTRGQLSLDLPLDTRRQPALPFSRPKPPELQAYELDQARRAFQAAGHHTIATSRMRSMMEGYRLGTGWRWTKHERHDGAVYFGHHERAQLLSKFGGWKTYDRFYHVQEDRPGGKQWTLTTDASAPDEKIEHRGSPVLGRFASPQEAARAATVWHRQNGALWRPMARDVRPVGSRTTEERMLRRPRARKTVDDPTRPTQTQPAEPKHKHVKLGTRYVWTLRRRDPTPETQWKILIAYSVELDGRFYRVVPEGRAWRWDRHDFVWVGEDRTEYPTANEAAAAAVAFATSRKLRGRDL